MSPQESEQQHYCINITLTKDFLKWTHSHRLLDGEAALSGQFWTNTPEESKFSFGGRFGTQFKTLSETESFIKAFKAMMKKHQVGDQHTHSLFYLMAFLNEDTEQQSIENNRNNHQHEYAKFLLDLIADSLNHIATMKKNDDYTEFYDKYTDEIFFARNDIASSMPYGELIEHVSKQPGEVIKYIRIKVYDDELYVPEDMVFTLRSKVGRKLKSFSGEQLMEFEMPRNLKYEIFTYMIGNMLADHKRYNTEFYQMMIKKDSMLSDFKGIVNKNKKHVISNVKSLARVGTLVTDYLIKHKVYNSKRSIAGFLFNYFALFKAILLKKEVLLPSDYEELPRFYIRNGITQESIRLIMKEA